MCEFISWKEIKTADGSMELLFLTHDDIFNTSRGAELRQLTTPEDFVGHGAIAFYYQIDANKGVDRECTNFSSPDNFPPEIVSALKAGKLWGIVEYFPEGLLCVPLYDDYKAKRDALDEDYNAKHDALYADYKAKHDALFEDCKAKHDALGVGYEAKHDALRADYGAKREALFDDYKVKRGPLYADYKAKCKALSNEQWELFTEPKNRAEVWR